jgi:hypothetical protein
MDDELAADNKAERQLLIGVPEEIEGTPEEKADGHALRYYENGGGWTLYVAMLTDDLRMCYHCTLGSDADLRGLHRQLRHQTVRMM